MFESAHRASSTSPIARRGLPRAAVLAAVVVCLAVAGAGWWWFARGASPARITVDGMPVAQAGATLRTADARFADYVRTERGATNHGRCYFERSGSATTTDVTATIYCGPVLFYGSSPTTPYLTYDTNTVRSNGAVTLTPSAQPGSAVVSAPTAWLVRPDRRRPPRDANGVKLPPAPAAPASFLQPEGDDGISAGDTSEAPPSATMGSRNLSITLESSGYVPYVGVRAAARSAPPGERMLAFHLNFSGGEAVQLTMDRVNVAVQAGSGPLRRLSLSGMTLGPQWFAMAVPASVRDVSLVLTDAGYVQRMSLLSGATGPGNIRVLAGRSTTVSLSITGTALADVTSNEEFTAHLSVRVTGAKLSFFLPEGVRPARTDRAFLTFQMCFTSVDFIDKSGCSSFRGSELLLTIPGHPAERPRLILSEGDYYGAFDVPWNFTAGTVTISGSEQSPHDNFHLTITQPCTFPFIFPE